MAIFGNSRDMSLFRHWNRELMGDILNEQCAIYKIKLDKTTVNIYGESDSNGKFYNEPVLFNCLILRSDQTQNIREEGIDFKWDIEFRFLKDDLVDANILVEIGDIIFYNEKYYEIINTTSNQLFLGKDPDYPNESNPLNHGLGEFGYNASVICKTIYVPADKVEISKERII